MNDIERKVEKQDYELQAIKESVARVLTALEKQTDAVTELTKQFAVFVTTHDSLQKKMDEVEKKVGLLEQFKAASMPVIEAVRGTAWKIVGSLTAGIAGGGILVTALAELAK